MSRLFYLCLIVGVASAATFMGNVPQKPAHLAHKEGCYVQEAKDVIPFGSQATPIGNCVRIECARRRLYYATCSIVSTFDQKCRKTETDLTKPYPDCCPTIKCETDNQV